jgi:hypothetical protein
MSPIARLGVLEDRRWRAPVPQREVAADLSLRLSLQTHLDHGSETDREDVLMVMMVFGWVLALLLFLLSPCDIWSFTPPIPPRLVDSWRVQSGAEE